MISPETISELERLESKATKGEWRKGTTLLTTQTKRWSKDEWAQNEVRENNMLFSNMSGTDQGRSRKLLLTANLESGESYENIQLIAAARNALPSLLSEIKKLREENKNYRAIHGELILLKSYFSDGNLEVTLHRNDVLPLLKMIQKLKGETG
jgi:hypothetical protein